VNGTFWATSDYFGHWAFEVLPNDLNKNMVTVEGVDSLTPVPSPGTNWTLDTSGAPGCGYVVRLRAFDRTVLDSGQNRDRFNAFKDQGFCVRPTPPPQ
jgi:hypothetical protein